MIVVTGASGLIGAHVVHALADGAGEAVCAVDVYAGLPGYRPGCDRLPAARYLSSEQAARFVDRHDLLSWLELHGEQVTAVIHLGACSDTTVTDRELLAENNTRYTQRLWTWCAQAHVPLLYASSAATYGDGSQGFDDQQDPARLRPLNAYGDSKHQFDLWALEQQHAPPRWAGLKYFNVYGPLEDHKGKMASVVWHGARQVRETGKMKLFRSYRDDVPDGEQRRDFVFVRDAVDATLFLLDVPVSDAAPNGLYNVGSGRARSFNELAAAVFAALDRHPRVIYIPMPEELRERYQYFTEATTAKLRRAGCAVGRHSLEEGVFAYLNDCRWSRKDAA